MFSISKKYSFSAAHQIEGHPKCGRIHGHNYEIEIILFATKLGPNGMIMDYNDLDEFVKPIIDGMDHKYLVSQENIDAKNPVAIYAIENKQSCMTNTQHSTAEELAQTIASWIVAEMLSKWTVNAVQVVVSETPKSTARYHATHSED